MQQPQRSIWRSGGEEFVESGSYVEETVKDSDRPVTGFWADQAVMEEIFADGE